MQFPGFVGPGYTLQSVVADCQRCVGWFPEVNELHTQANGNIASLVQIPGLNSIALIGDGPIRGIYATSAGKIAVVSGNKVYRMSVSGEYALAGTLLTSSGPVGMADNGSQLIIVDGPYGYIISLADGKFSRILTESFPGASSVVFQDGYFIATIPVTGQFGISSLYDGFSWDALDFGVAEGAPDNLLSCVSNMRQIWLFGQETIEVWWNSGNADFPFTRIDGAFIEFGCAAGATAQKFNNSVAWLGGGRRAAGIVWTANGFLPRRISNHAVEAAISRAGELQNATAFTYQENGHSFYCLNIPGSDTTWVYDSATEQWSERVYLGKFGLERHRAENYAFANGTHFVGDYATGNVYKMSADFCTDNGTPIYRMRRSPHLSDDMQRVFYTMFQLDVSTGIGLDSLGESIWDGSYDHHSVTNSATTGTSPGPYTLYGADGLPAVPTNTPTLTGSGPWSGLFTVAGETFSVLPGPISITDEVIPGSGTSLTMNESSPIISLLTRTDWQGTKYSLSTLARKNYCSFSQALDNAAWTNVIGGTGVACTVTADWALGPEGNMTAERIQFNQGAGTTSADLTTRRTPSMTGFTVGQKVIISFWAKSNTSNRNLYIGGSSVTSGNATVNLTTTLQRFTVDLGNAVNVTGQLILGLRGTFTTGSTADITITDIQVEQNGSAVATPFILTTTAAKTVIDYALSGSVLTLGESVAAGSIRWTGTYTGTVHPGTTFTASFTYDRPHMVAELGVDPVIALRWSDDFGRTWSPEQTTSMGAIGAYRTQLKWWRLGQSFTRVYEISCTEPVRVTVMGAELNIKKAV